MQVFKFFLFFQLFVFSADKSFALVTNETAKQAIRDAYAKILSIDVPEPFYVAGRDIITPEIIVLDESGKQAKPNRQINGWQSRLWLKKRGIQGVVVDLYLDVSGQYFYAINDMVTRPEGDVRVALFITDNGKTNIAEDIELWDNTKALYIL